MKLNHFIFIVIMVILNGFLQSEQKPTIAVSDIQTESIMITTTFLNELSMFIESELIKTNIYTVITRKDDEIKKIFDELRLTEELCFDVECSQKIGNIVGADYLLHTNLDYKTTRDKAMVIMKILNVEFGTVDTMLYWTPRVKKLSDLFYEIPYFVAELSGFDHDTGVINFTGFPDGAYFRYGLKKIKLPVSNFRIKSGRNTEKIRKPGFRGKKFFMDIEKYKYYKYDYKLKPVNPFLPKLLSFSYPGLGHLYAEDFRKGWFYLISESIILFGLYNRYEKFNSAQSYYLSAHENYLEYYTLEKKEMMIEMKTNRDRFLDELVGIGITSFCMWFSSQLSIRKLLKKSK